MLTDGSEGESARFGSLSSLQNVSQAEEQEAAKLAEPDKAANQIIAEIVKALHNSKKVTRITTTPRREFSEDQTSEELEIENRRSSNKEYGANAASNEEIVTEKASEKKIGAKVTEGTVAEDVSPDHFGKYFTEDIWKYIAANSDMGLRVELEGPPRAQLSLLPLPYPRHFAEPAPQGMGSSQVVTPTCDLISYALANANSSPCNNEFLASKNAGLLEN